VEKPARYIGGEVRSVRKQDYSLLLALSYPDVYEIGIANQAVQILYSLVNHGSSAWAQRVYCPWPDMSALMREKDIPLFMLESWEPVSSADLWGITLQHELTYSNVLEMLDLAGVPLRQDRRGEDYPLVFAGGPSASNPHPMAAFFDFIIIGDGELVLPRVLAVCEEGRGLSRGEARAAVRDRGHIRAVASGAGDAGGGSGAGTGGAAAQARHPHHAGGA
jgi:radical SAM superfamily enzyme YgiQ (UPF0313 family)